MNNRLRKNRKGWMLIDITVTISIMVVLFVCLSLTMTATNGYNRFIHTRRQCLSAAQAQMDSLAARGHLIGEEDMERLFEGIVISVDTSAGQGDWKGMEMVKIIAAKPSGRKNVRIQLQQYMAQRN